MIFRKYKFIFNKEIFFLLKMSTGRDISNHTITRDDRRHGISAIDNARSNWPVDPNAEARVLMKNARQGMNGVS